MELAASLGDAELIGPSLAYRALALESAGQINEALDTHERARIAWVPGKRLAELAMLNELQSDLAYWVGDYATAERRAKAAYELGGKSHSVQPVLRGGGWRGLVMAAQGRSEEAIDWLNSIFVRAQEVDPRWGAATLNYLSLPLRDMLLFDEARRRNEQALDMVTARGAWGMPELHGEIDLMLADLALGDFGRVETSFPRVWDAAINGKAWRPWLGGSRLAYVRAELARAVGDVAAAAEFARDALDRARRIGRQKYEASASAVLGWALVKSNLSDDGIHALRTAVATADRVGSPGPRWQHRAMLAAALFATGDDDGAATAYLEAKDAINAYAGSLKPEHARHFLDAEAVRGVLKASD